MPHYKVPNKSSPYFLGEDVDPIKWLPEGATLISDSEAETMRLALSPEFVPTYQELRAAAYPPITDYLDGIVKGDAAQVQAYVDACLAVKALYPKP
jgi:hypothetical protein